jgi:hypothetical protein
MGKLFLQDNSLHRKGNDPLDIEGDTNAIARAFADCNFAHDFFLPNVFLSLSKKARVELEAAMKAEPTLEPWWASMKSDYATLNGLLTWDRKDLDVVWSAEYATSMFTEILRTSAGQVFVVMIPLDKDPAQIKSETEFNACSPNEGTLEAHIRGAASIKTSAAEQIIAIIRSPMVDREISIGNLDRRGELESMETTCRRGPAETDCGGWGLNLKQNQGIMGETDI